MKREEEIEQNAFDKAVKYSSLGYEQTPFADGYIAGAQWADEHPKNPWHEAKNDPPKDMKPVIGIDKEGVVCHYEYSPEEKIWSVGMLLSDAPEFWMSTPETPKGK